MAIRGSALNWAKLTCLLAIWLLAACAGTPPFKGDGVAVRSIDVFPIENREVSANALMMGLDEGDGFEKLGSLLLDAPTRWENFRGRKCMCIPTHCLYVHLRDGRTLEVWIHGSTWKAQGWELRLTDGEFAWFSVEAEWNE